MAKGIERGIRINLPVTGERGIADHHQDIGALRNNADVDYRDTPLGTVLPIRGTDSLQTLGANKESLLKHTQLVLWAGFTAPIGKQERDFIAPQPDEFLEEYDRHERVFSELLEDRRFRPVSSVEDLYHGVVYDPDQAAVGVIKTVEGLYVDKNNWRQTIKKLKEEHGVRSIGIMWNFDTEVGATTAKAVRFPEDAPPSPDTGLSKLGREVVKYIDQQDMLVDLSHASDRTIDDVLKVLKNGKNPPIVTHSGSRAVTDHPRNITDKHAMEIYKRGGIIGIPFVGPFIGGERTVDDVVKHIEHFKNLGILDAVVLGSDFNGMANTSVVEGVHDVTVAQENLTTAMIKHGFTTQEIEGVLFRNAYDFWIKHLPSEDPQGKEPFTEKARRVVNRTFNHLTGAFKEREVGRWTRAQGEQVVFEAAQ